MTVSFVIDLAKEFALAQNIQEVVHIVIKHFCNFRLQITTSFDLTQAVSFKPCIEQPARLS